MHRILSINYMFIYFLKNHWLNKRKDIVTMKIEKIILKNFSAIYNAMGTDYLCIDFTGSKNNICLIIGPNGSGKTTLMSLLTPFSNLGNLDIRDGNEMILEDKEGYKEIHIDDGYNYYIIKHFYFPHKGKNHSVKSYIEKNGNELNINGNVTSFKEYIKIELGIDPDYLKLIRLGNNVTSMIDLSETERKNFMSKLLDEIGVSLSFYKKVNNDLRQLKQMINLDVDKLHRLGIEDVDLVKDEIKRLEKELNEEQKKYGLLSGDISVHQHELDKIENKEMLRTNLSQIEKKIKKMEGIMSRKEELESTEVSYYVMKIDRLQKEKIQIEADISTLDTLIKNVLSDIDQFDEQLRVVNVELQKEEESDSELSKMKEEHRKLKVEFSYRSNFYEEYHPPCAKEEFDAFVLFLKNTQQILNKTYEFGNKPIKKVISIMKKHGDVMNYINAGIMNINERAEEENSNLLRILSNRYSFMHTNFEFCPNVECPARQVWAQISTLLQDRNAREKNGGYEYFKDVELCYENIKTALEGFKEWETLISKLPNNIKASFTLDKIYQRILDNSLIYDDKAINELMSLLTEYDDIDKLKIQMEELEVDIEKFTKLSNLDYLINQKKYFEDKGNASKEKLTELKSELSLKNEQVKEIVLTLESMEELKETFEKYDELRELMKKLEESYESYKSNTQAIISLEREIKATKAKIQKITDDIQIFKNRVSQYKIIKKELKKYEKYYDEMYLVKEALSSKKGMPLYHIKQYFGNTEEITNELLNIAYNGEVYIDKFHITPNEFQIPFYIRGKKMKDVKYASQGELSFLSIALSFGLSSQSLSKYNIMLLDEIDGPLDSRNREKFIRILENQIERIGSEQNFLITHNNMFSSYPVDIIDLSFEKDKDNTYELANYIPIYREEIR